MGMPELPEGKNRPSIGEALIDLLESIALEEMAIAHLLNAEGEKLQDVVKKYCESEICHTQFESSFNNSQDMVRTLIMKEWLLLTKMNSVLEINKQINTECNSNKRLCECERQSRNWKQ